MTTTPALAGPFHGPEHESPLGITSYLDKAAGVVQDAARFAHIKLVTSLSAPENNMPETSHPPKRMGNFMLHAMNRVTESPFGISVAGATCTRIALNTVHAYGQIRYGTDLGIHQGGHSNHMQYTLAGYELDQSAADLAPVGDMDGDGDVDATDTRLQYERNQSWPVPNTTSTEKKTVDLEVPTPAYYDNTEQEEDTKANAQTVLAGFLCGAAGIGAGIWLGWMMRRNRYVEIAITAERKKEREREEKARNEESGSAETDEGVHEELIGEGAAPGDDYPSMRAGSGTVGGLRWDGETGGRR